MATSLTGLFQIQDESDQHSAFGLTGMGSAGEVGDTHSALAEQRINDKGTSNNPNFSYDIT
jgi:hypothetical protein